MTPVPTVSVVVVNFDRPDTLALTLKALEYLRYPMYEVVVVSNLDPALRPPGPLPIRWMQFTDANISAARNHGIAAAGGEIVAFCDDDAVPEFGWLDALTAPFADDAVGAAGGFVRGRNGVSFQWKAISFDRLGRDRPIPFDSDTPRVFDPDPESFVKTVGTNCAFRRSALTQIGGFDEAFRYYLDEADVNLRLALAGWKTAVVPLAEVHHGYAAGPYRNPRRVPRSLFEIGASQAHFVHKHAGPKDLARRLDTFRRMQHRRLSWFFHHGLIDAQQWHRLSASLAEGIDEGLARTPAMAGFTAPQPAFAPARAPECHPERVFLVSNPLNRTSMRDTAANAAAQGAEVTLLEPEFSPRHLKVHFTGAGYWRHRFGLGGLAERHASRPFSGPRHRIATELRRIAAQRGLDCMEE